MSGLDPLADIEAPPGRRPARCPSRGSTGRKRRAGVLAALAVAGVLLPGCAQAEDAARDAAREAVAEATAAVGAAGSEAGQQLAGQAVSDALDALPGTCADVLALPSGVRAEQAETVLRSFWVAELDTGVPPQETVDAFEAAVLDRCADSRETQAADVLREVWESGDHRP